MRSLALSLALLTALAAAGMRSPALTPTDATNVAPPVQPLESSSQRATATKDCLCQSGNDSRPRDATTLALDVFSDDFSYDDRALWHAHGQQICKSGCAASNHPTLDLTAFEFRRLLTEYASSPADENGSAFEALLYFGKQTRDLLAREGASPLDQPHARRLARELSRTHARVSVRIIDADGRRRVWLPPTRVPLDRRHVFTMETVDLQPLVTSGTVKRVGQDYLWVRL
ncbi:MAG: hypothetical protein WD875_05005 [Pirellulales bacterium]